MVELAFKCRQAVRAVFLFFASTTVCGFAARVRPQWPAGPKTQHGRVAGFVVVVNKFVYKLVVVVNAHPFVDKTGFLHNVNGLRSR